MLGEPARRVVVGLEADRPFAVGELLGAAPGEVARRVHAGTVAPRLADTMTRAEPRVPPFVMDRPVLHAFLRELVEHERLGDLADALPARARVSEPALPVLLAALHERLERPLVCLLAEDADARDAAEAASWFLGDEPVGFLPSRGVSWESGLEPPPHLVGERARALHVLARGGLVCVSARALAEAMPPAEARPEPIELRAGSEPRGPRKAPGLPAGRRPLGRRRFQRGESRGSPSRSASPATSASSGWTTAASSPSAAA